MTKVTVVEVRDEGQGVRLFRVQRTDKRAFEEFTAGAHVDVTGPTGVTRQYSLCGPPKDRTQMTFAVKLEEESRGGSRALHEEVSPGDELTVSTPRNLFPLYLKATRHVLVGAGIGVTPLLSMAYELHRLRKPFALHYFVRDAATAAFVTMLREGPFAGSVTVHEGLSRQKQQEVLEGFLGAVDEDEHVYTCGPEGFMDRVVDIGRRTLPEDNLHREHFTAVDTTGMASDSFEVELDTGEVFEVPADKSIVEVLGENGVEIDTSCREGICGTCVLTVLSGEPDHRDNCLTAKEKARNDQMATCVSRARSARLVLELE
ncbi:PDR/VanB family oxidoreductase [Kineococcus sp. SYSU DK001]|uniref:PDR/VanB family oxidoreductase n=1 Tax=Kineococcus sp. SYSU DK001 TaxID=3383122 RepID=UPI003D7C9B1E